MITHDNTNSPETHTAYFNQFFHKDRIQARLGAIQRYGKRKAEEAGISSEPVPSQHSSRSPNPPKRPTVSQQHPRSQLCPVVASAVHQQVAIQQSRVEVSPAAVNSAASSTMSQGEQKEQQQQQQQQKRQNSTNEQSMCIDISSDDGDGDDDDDNDDEEEQDEKEQVQAVVSSDNDNNCDNDDSDIEVVMVLTAEQQISSTATSAAQATETGTTAPSATAATSSPKRSPARPLAPIFAAKSPPSRGDRKPSLSSQLKPTPKVATAKKSKPKKAAKPEPKKDANQSIGALVTHKKTSPPPAIAAKQSQPTMQSGTPPVSLAVTVDQSPSASAAAANALPAAEPSAMSQSTSATTSKDQSMVPESEPNYPSAASLLAAREALSSTHSESHSDSSRNQAACTDGDDKTALESLITMTSQRWVAIKKETAGSRKDRAKQLLREKRDSVMKEVRRVNPKPTNATFAKRLDTNQVLCTSKGGVRKEASFFGCRKEERTKTTLPTIRLDGAGKAQPRHCAPITISTWILGDNRNELEAVPYFRSVEDDNKHEESLKGVFSVKNRDRKIIRGPYYREKEMDEQIDLLLNHLCGRVCLPDSSGRFHEAKRTALRQPIAYSVWKVTGINYDWLQERYDVLVKKSAKRNEEQCKESDPPGVNFRQTFCNRCFIYDCAIHESEKPSCQLQYEKAHKRAKDGFWEDAEFEPSKLCPAPEQQQLIDLPREPTQLLEPQITLCKKMFLIFQGDVSKISTALKIPESEVTDVITSNNLKLPECKIYKGSKWKKLPNKGKYHSMRNYDRKWLNRMEGAENHPWCEPCTHDEPCSPENCSCWDGRFWCTKNCGHAEISRTFFRGCDCKAGCKQTSCTCFAANRECDPDLCKPCGACTDPPGFQESPKQRCCNDNISMRRHARLLIAPSTVGPHAGWGLFTKYALKKGDYIHEYLGELIESDEADRRGHLYDKHGCSYLFEQSREYLIDGMDKANKVRFANHRDNPNLEVKKMFVNGDVRIGYFAKYNIKAQSEVRSHDVLECECAPNALHFPNIPVTCALDVE